MKQNVPSDKNNRTDSDSQPSETHGERRNVKRFTAAELRSSAQQLSALLRTMIVFCAVIAVDQIILAVKDRSYSTRAVFFSVVTLMAALQIGRLHSAIQRYKKGESEGSLIAAFSELRNFVLTLTFFTLLLTVILVIRTF